MNTTTMLSTTDMYIHVTFAKIQGFSFFNVILVLSCWCMTGPRAGPQLKCTEARVRGSGEGYTISDHDVKNQKFHAKMNIP